LKKFVLTAAIVLFLSIFIASFVKKKKSQNDLVYDIKQKPKVELKITQKPIELKKEIKITKEPLEIKTKKEIKKEEKLVKEIDLPDANLIDRLFATDSSKLENIVETLTYTPRVPWLKDRAAWIADYASHYSTTRHFIARSLNKKADYFTQKIQAGDRFNVIRLDKNINFYLLMDLNKSKMWFYAIDKDSNEKTLLKSYNIGLGRKDPSRKSGYLTPTGVYQLGEKVALYKPDTMGYFQDQKVEMVTVFGTRWIPFEKEIEDCTESAKGLGIHGVPWSNKDHKEDLSKIGNYDSDGCIRLASNDIEEIFAIVISRPTFIELTNDFFTAKLFKEKK
jgi:lipoprotein-anchoring transpeptidase ErfK/SrfK